MDASVTSLPRNEQPTVKVLCERLRFAADNDPHASVILRDTQRQAADLLEHWDGVIVRLGVLCMQSAYKKPAKATGEQQ